MEMLPTACDFGIRGNHQWPLWSNRLVSNRYMSMDTHTHTHANAGKNTRCCYEESAKDAVGVNRRHSQDDVRYVTTSASKCVCIYSSRISQKTTQRSVKMFLFLWFRWFFFSFLLCPSPLSTAQMCMKAGRWKCSHRLHSCVSPLQLPPTCASPPTTHPTSPPLVYSPSQPLPT